MNAQGQTAQIPETAKNAIETFRLRLKQSTPAESAEMTQRVRILKDTHPPKDYPEFIRFL